MAAGEASTATSSLPRPPSPADLLNPHLLRISAAGVLSAPPGRNGLWVRRAARNLIDGLPEEKGVPGVASDEFLDGFHDPLSWLKEAAARAHPVLPWFPVDCRSLMGSGTRAGRGGGDGLDGVELETLVLVQGEYGEMQEAGRGLPPQTPPLEDSIKQSGGYAEGDCDSGIFPGGPAGGEGFVGSLR